METQLLIKEKKNVNISRIDQSVADNLRDIEQSFGMDAGIVTDFIVFATKNLKSDLFGFTQFTLTEFCKESGRNKQDMHIKHPIFEKTDTLPPDYFGHKFESVFDYVLFRMLEKNIIFTRNYSYNDNGKVIHLQNFPILKDIKLNIDRNSNGVKVYEIRVSDQLLTGFMKRYYTIESNGYRMVGKGRGGDGRKRLFIFLYKTKHILSSQNTTITQVPIDYLAQIANIEVKENKLRKVSIKRVLDAIKVNGQLPFSYTFVQGDATKKFQENYWVELDFSEAIACKELIESRGDNCFFSNLLNDLKFYFNNKYENISIKDEKDQFQRWLTNSSVDLDDKSGIVQSVHYRAYGRRMTPSKAMSFIKMGAFLD